MTKVAIAILNWQQSKLTQETISSLKKIKHPGFSYHIYLLDNGSADNSYSVLHKTYSKDKQITLLHSPTNLGFAAGNNYLFKKIPLSLYKYVLMLNNDVIVDSLFLKELIEVAKKHPKFSILGPKIYFAQGFEFHKNRYQPSDKGKVIWSAGGTMDWQNVYGSNRGIDQIDIGQYDYIDDKVDFLSGCAMLIKVNVLKKLQFFDNRYYMYLEDVDLCHKAKKQNFQIAYVPKSKIWHINSGSSSAGSSLHDYFLTRNRILFAFKFTPLKTKLAILRQAFSILFKSKSNWQKRGVVDAFIGRWGRGSW
jgi:hypothetical protein